MRKLPRITRALRAFTDLGREINLQQPNDLDKKKQEVSAKVKR